MDKDVVETFLSEQAALDEETAFIASWEAAVSHLYDFALAGSRMKRGGFSDVSATLAARLLAELGIDASGYQHMIDADGLRHIHRQHGGSSESSRGQIAIVKQDILNLHHVVNNPDTLALADEGRHGLTRIEVTKEIAGYKLYCILELRRGRKWLCPVTLYKRKTK